VFQILDIAAGSLTLALLPALAHFLRKTKLAYRWVLLVAVGVIGADSVIDACLPISCAPSVDAQCSLAAAASHSLITSTHLAESTLVGIVIFVAPALWWWACRGKRRVIAQISAQLVVTQLIVGLGIVLGRVVHHDITGVLQRFYQLGIGVWMTSILFTAIVRPRRQTSPSFEPNVQET
jgi:hypothetical protein